MTSMLSQHNTPRPSTAASTPGALPVPALIPEALEPLQELFARPSTA
jgi:hypothetical protein